VNHLLYDDDGMHPCTYSLNFHTEISPGKAPGFLFLPDYRGGSNKVNFDESVRHFSAAWLVTNMDLFQILDFLALAYEFLSQS
jgi:hypothetical protein